MSLIIKGIDLPKEGYASNIDIVYNGDVWISKNGEWELHEKSAIQIEKPHGRLIDERELKSKIHDVTLEGGILHGCIDKTKIHECKTILKAEDDLKSVSTIMEEK